VLVRPDDLCDFIRDALHAHLRQLVVRRDFWRIDHVPFFPFELLLDASIEKESDMCILFGLCVQHVGGGGKPMSTLMREMKGLVKRLTCYVRLLDVVLGEPLGEHVSHRLRRVGNWKWELGIIARHGGYVLLNSSDFNRNEGCTGKGAELTRSFGMSTSTGLASWPSTVLISRMRSER
jgi:hypothetical protein